MNSSRAQHGCQVGIAIFSIVAILCTLASFYLWGGISSILVVLCVFGSYWFGSQAREQKDKGLVEEIRQIRDKSPNPTNVLVLSGDLTVKNSISVQKTEVVTPASEKEARILFTLPSFEISNSHNVSGIVDNALGDVSIVFEEDFPTDDYYVNINGDKTIEYKIIEKDKGYIRIIFEEKDMRTVQVECKNR